MKGAGLRVLALAGGVGGAKLAWGLGQALPPDALTIVANTGDDDTFHGLHVSPDLDTLMYTLAGLSDPDRGWGLAGETFHTLDMLRHYGQPAWFSLGDRDFATHILRTQLLNQGKTLSEATTILAQKLGVACALAPMSDAPVRTTVHTDDGVLAMQVYFVQRRCEPAARRVSYCGAARARMSPAFAHGLATADAVVYCPSNPILSIDPIVAMGDAAEALRAFRGPRIAVSPIVGGEALRGPAAKMMAELGEEASCVGVARRLAGLCDVLVIDTADACRAADVDATGLEPIVRDTIMHTPAEKTRLAEMVCSIARERLP